MTFEALVLDCRYSTVDTQGARASRAAPYMGHKLRTEGSGCAAPYWAQAAGVCTRTRVTPTCTVCSQPPTDQTPVLERILSPVNSVPPTLFNIVPLASALRP